MNARTRWLTRKETADLLGTLGCPFTPKRLTDMVNEHPYRGPPFYRTFGRVRYHADEVRAWAVKNMERVE